LYLDSYKAMYEWANKRSTAKSIALVVLKFGTNRYLYVQYAHLEANFLILRFNDLTAYEYFVCLYGMVVIGYIQ